MAGGGASTTTGSGNTAMQVMQNPFVQAGLTLMTTDRDQNPYGRSLGAFNQAAATNQRQSMLAGQEERAQQEFAMRQREYERREKMRQEMPGVALSMIQAKTPEDRQQAMTSILRYKPELVSTMLGTEKEGSTSMIKNFQQLQSMPEGKEKEEFRKMLMKSQTEVNINTAQPLKASELKNYQDRVTGKAPPPGSTQADLMAGNYEIKMSTPTTEAGRTAMAKQSYETVQSIRNMVIKNGEVDLKAVAQLSIPGTQLNSQFRDAIASSIYIKSGAAASAEEVNTQVEIYKPKLWSSAAAVNDRLRRLEEFFSSTVESTGAPAQGITQPPNMIQQQEIPTVPAVPTQPTPEQPNIDDLLRKYQVMP